MAESYKQARGIPALDKNYLLKSQREFIRRREGCAKTNDVAQCILSATTGRRAELDEMIEAFWPKAVGGGNVRSLTGKFEYRIGYSGGVIEIKERPGGVLSLDYDSEHSGHTCNFTDLTVSKREAENYVAKSQPVPFYNDEYDIEMKISFFDNGVLLSKKSNRRSQKEFDHMGFCGMRGAVYDNGLYVKIK
jgi:hypothetical protein